MDAMVDKLRRDAEEHVLWGTPGDESRPRTVFVAQQTELPAALRIRLQSSYPSYRRAQIGSERGAFQWNVREWGGLAGGTLQPVNARGDHEGLVAWRAGVEFEAYSDHFEIRLGPELRLDAGCSEDLVCGSAPLTEAMLAVNVGGFRLDFGSEQRETGPGARGNLVLGRSIRPWPAGTIHYARDSKFGLLAAEMGIGWLPGERTDVMNPGLMHMDFRWSPSALLEFGLTRATMFGGEGRPLPTVFDLILPSQPHVSGDPDKILADSNEIAAVDARFDLPLGRWWGIPVQRLSLWYQYGGEDLIMSELGPIPVPSLGGPANLYGGSLSFGEMELTIERAQLMDDTFRWYTGHRVYHEGFVRDGQAIGHPHGGDADSFWLEWAYYGSPLGMSVHVEKVRKVGVVSANPGGVFTLATDESSLRGGVRFWMLPIRGGHIGVGYSVQRLEGEGFIPGALSWHHRGGVEMTRPLRSMPRR